MAASPVKNFEAWPNKKAKLEEEKIGDKSDVDEEEMGDGSKVEAETMDDKPEVEAEKMENDEEEDLSGYESNNTEETGITFRGCDDEQKKEMRRYFRKLAKDGPYEVDFFPRMSYISAVLPMDPEEDPEKFEQAKNCAQFAIEEHNKDKDQKFKLESVKKVTFHWTCGIMFFITLVARDTKSGKELTCRARVWDNTIGGYRELMEFIVL